MKYWRHACGNTLKLIPMDQVCKVCGINREVEAVRFSGHVPQAPVEGRGSRFSFLKRAQKQR